MLNVDPLSCGSCNSDSSSSLINDGFLPQNIDMDWIEIKGIIDIIPKLCGRQVPVGHREGPQELSCYLRSAFRRARQLVSSMTERLLGAISRFRKITVPLTRKSIYLTLTPICLRIDHQFMEVIREAEIQSFRIKSFGEKQSVISGIERADPDT